MKLRLVLACLFVSLTSIGAVTSVGDKVGIGTKPTEALHVVGNLRFSGAFMPNNAAGTAGQVLQSAGPGLPPTWQTASGGGNVTGTGVNGSVPFWTGASSLSNDGSNFSWDNSLKRLLVSGNTAGPTIITTAQQNSASWSQFTVSNSNARSVNLQAIGSTYPDGTIVNWGRLVAEGTLSGLQIAIDSNKPLLFSTSTGASLVDRQRIEGNGNITWDASDTTMFLDAVNNRVAIGGNAPLAQLDVTANNTNAVSYASVFSNTATHTPIIGFVRSRGTPGARAALQTNDWVGSYRFNGATDSIAINAAAAITVTAAANYVGNSSSPGNMSIETTPTGAIIPVERILVQSTGNVRFDGADNTMFVDAVNNRTGFGTAGPTERVDISGNLRVSGAFMPNNTAGTSGQLLQSNGPGVAPTWINNAIATTTADTYPVPAMVTGAQDSRQAQTTYEGCIYTLLRPASFTTVHFRTLATTGSPTISMHLYADNAGAGVGTQTRRATITAFATATANTNYAATVSEGTVTLPAGRIFVLWGSASAGTVTLRTYGTQAYDLLNANVPSGLSPQTYSTALGAGTTPATINPASGTGDLVGSVNATCPVIRLD